jgi:hypothetical protein
MQRNTHVRHLAPALRPLAACLAAALAIETPGVAWAANLIVSNCSDSGAGSLRDTVSQAATGDTVDLTRLQCSSITLTSGEIATSLSDLSLVGPGASALNISGRYDGRILDHTGAGTLAISGVTVSKGSLSDANGGCIYSKGNVGLVASTLYQCLASSGSVTVMVRGGAVYTKGNLQLTKSILEHNEVTSAGYTAEGGGAFVSGDFEATSSTISHNYGSNSESTSQGGGVYVLGNVDIESSSIFSNSAGTAAGLFLAAGTGHSAKIVNSTISSNSATVHTGGVYTGIPLTLQNSTIANNSAQSSSDSTYTIGVGLQLQDTIANIQSSIIANNRTPAGIKDVGGIGSKSTHAAIASTSRNNLIRISSLTLPAGTLRSDPMLGSLTYSGASPPFLPLLAGSPAIDAGNDESGAHYDQRGNGNARLVGTAADIGAYEKQSTGITTIVSNCADSGTGSLRDNLAKAQSGDTLDLTALHCKITLTSGELATDLSNVTLLGPGANLLTIDGNLQGRVFDHNGYGTVALSGMTLSRGYQYAPNTTASGGCVLSASTVTLLNSTVTLCRALSNRFNARGGGISAERIITENSAVTASAASAPMQIFGGGLYAASYLSIDQSSVSGNQAIPAGHGGGIYAGSYATVLVTGSTISGNQAYIGGGLAGADAKIVNSTVSGNSATAVGGLVTSSGLSLYNSTVAFNTSLITLYNATQIPAGISVSGLTRLQSSIIFGNTSNSKSYDVGGTGKIIGANNLVGTSSSLLPIDTIRSDPLLGPLQNNGGATFTHALPPNSPAVDAGNNIANLPFDQRGSGFARDSGPAVDIGAFETQDTIFANGFEVPL